MFNVLTILGEVLKSNLVTGIVNALIANVAVPAPNAEISKTVSTAASNTSVAAAAQSVASAIVPALKTWTPEELSAAESAWASQQPAGDITPNSAFAAGVAWAIAHQTSTLTSGIANAVAEHTGVSASVVQAVEGAALDAAEAAVTGGTGAAVAVAVGDAAKAVEAVEAAPHAEAPAPAEPAAQAPAPGSSAEPNKA